MKLRARLQSPEQAWREFLEFSSGSVEVLRRNERLAAWAKQPADLLVEKGLGRYQIEWRQISQETDSPSRRQEALREWQRAELVRLGFLDFATLSSAKEAGIRTTDLAEFTLRTTLAMAREEAPEADRKGTKNFSVLALGKMGAGDLNYFSDIDLIFLEGEGSERDACLRLARGLVERLDARGGNSLYRVDLRLRPEGDRGPLVVTQENLEEYYATYGELWERCAWIRGRWVAGDEESAYSLFRLLQGFIYPRGLSPSSLGELFQQKTRAEDELIAPGDEDREMKRGRGGLREVEFPVLGLQLLHGARQPTLQTHDLRKAMRNLKTLGLLQSEEAETLLGGYNFWRKLEDRLQLRKIQQTHLLPDGKDELTLLARSLDFASTSELERAVEEWRGKVRQVYQAICGELRSPVAAGVEFPKNIPWANPESARVGWEGLAPGGEVHATAGTKANFERLVPFLEKEFAQCARPDLGLIGFSNFTSAYGAKSLLYESLCVSPKALALLIRFFESSRALGPGLVARPELFEEVARAGLDGARGVKFHQKTFVYPKSEEEVMEAARLYVRGEELRIAYRGLLGLAEVVELQAELTGLAEACLGWAWHFAGKPKWAWIGLGKLGGEALSLGSDLDLLIVGEGEEAAQKAIRFLTEDLSTGTLFKVDFRLRPYAEGALVVPAKRYAEYYNKEAQAWEVQALSRARNVGGAKELGKAFWPAVEKAWSKTGQEKKFFGEVKAMRERIAVERVKSGEEERAYKTGRGGLIDVEFAAQAWQMREGMVEARTGKVLEAMAGKFPKEAKVLREGLAFWSAAEWWLRLDEGRGGSLLPKSGADLDWLSQRCGAGTGAEFMKEAEKMRLRVRAAYESVLG